MVQWASVAVPALYTPPPYPPLGKKYGLPVTELPMTVQLVRLAVPKFATPPPLE